jgi:TfoX/Sxy family transcriptional regulator of competence genes
MKKWERSSPELIARFDACLPKTAGVERRQMFGCPCAFVNGNMFSGVHEQRLIVRLGDKERASLAQAPDAGPFVVMGRTMREYIAFEKPLERTPREIGHWMKKALAYAQTLPPKARKTATAARRAASKGIDGARSRNR